MKNREQLVADLQAAHEDLMRATRRVKQCGDALARASNTPARTPTPPPAPKPIPRPAPEVLLPVHPDASRALGGLGRTKMYELITSGELQTVKIGRRRFVPASAVERYVVRLQEG